MNNKGYYRLIALAILTAVALLVFTPLACEREQPAFLQADTTYHKTLPVLPELKAKPVQPLAVQISLTADTLKRKQAEAKPIITRIRSTAISKRKELVTVDYIDPAGIETRIVTELQPGTWEVRGDTIMPVMQDKRSKRREKWRHIKRIGAAVGIGVIIGVILK